MPFTRETYYIDKPIKSFLFLMKKFNFTQAQAQRFISKGRLIVNGKPLLDKASIVVGEVEIVRFNPITRGIKPIFIAKDFAIFDKPSGIITHPNKMVTDYSMLDEIRYHFGQNANATHRIDMETSGLLLASRDKSSERFLKLSFEQKRIKKQYLAWVKGRVEREFIVEEPIKIRDNYSFSKHKVEISKDGKYAKTYFKPLKYNKMLDISLIEATPYTGRTHQIRIHLFHVKHSIVGDPLYGTEFNIAKLYLEGKLSKRDRLEATGANRLMLHANRLEFSYINRYKIVSKVDFSQWRSV